MRVRKSTATLLLVWLGGLALAYVAHAVLPQRYYIDARIIEAVIDNPLSEWEWSPSFQHTAIAWQLLGFGTLWPHALAAAAGYSIAIASIAWGVRMARTPWQPAVYLLLAMWCVAVVIYHGQYSKEMFAIVVVAVILRLSGSAYGVAAAVLVALAYAAVFRSYWALIVVLWLMLLAGWRIGISWPWRLLVVFVAILLLSAVSFKVMGFWLSDGRTIPLENRDLEVDATTVIFNPLDNTSEATDLANSAMGWLTLILPFYLFQLGAVQYVAFALFQLLNTTLFVLAARRAGGASGARAPGTDSWRYAAATSWCVAFTLVQGMFEPDFGSFLKHATTLAPMLAFIFLSARFVPAPLRHRTLAS